MFAETTMPDRGTSVTSVARPLRIVVDARLQDGECGGIQQTVIGLASGFSQLQDGDEQYLFLGFEDSGWLQPHLRGRCSLLPAPRAAPPAPRGLRSIAGRLAAFGPVRRSVERGFLGRLVRIEVPRSDGTIERASADVMHFATQAGFWTTVPTIYVPHDLQHFHHPEYFSPFELRWRAAHYGPLAQQARAVVALSRWGKDDLVRHLQLPPERIPVIGWAPPIDAYAAPGEAEIAAARQRFRLPERFVLYPAQTWRHKNHQRLVEALALLRDRDGLNVHAVFSGRLNDFYPSIRRRVRALRLEAQVRFLGYVAASDMACLYRAAESLVFPSEFEGFGMPVVEAFRVGLPVACSNATSLPELATGAALLFDPVRVDEIADALRRLWIDEALRAELAQRGRARAAALSWRDVARRYRALYRSVAGRELGGEDRELLREMAG
jgi:glycosyltransferase involved in cell wall biosynthesis